MASSGVQLAPEEPTVTTGIPLDSNHQRLSTDVVEMAESTGSLREVLPLPPKTSNLLAKLGLGGFARRTLGICLLLVTVCLWTVSNFLASVWTSFMTMDQCTRLLWANKSFAVHLLGPHIRQAILPRLHEHIRLCDILSTHVCLVRP